MTSTPDEPPPESGRCPDCGAVMLSSWRRCGNTHTHSPNPPIEPPYDPDEAARHILDEADRRDRAELREDEP